MTDHVTHLLNHFYRYESQEQTLQSRITSLEKELSHANDLLAAMKQRGLHESDVLSLSPAAAKASSLLKSGLSLTQIYSQYVEACEELGREKEETDRLNNYLEQINQELEEKTPALQKVRERGRGERREGEGQRYMCQTCMVRFMQRGCVFGVGGVWAHYTYNFPYPCAAASRL